MAASRPGHLLDGTGVVWWNLERVMAWEGVGFRKGQATCWRHKG